MAPDDTPGPEPTPPASGLGPLNDPEWVPQNAIEALWQERQYNTDENGDRVEGAETPVAWSQRLINEYLPAVTMGMIHQALYAADERVRLSAQKYLMDRSLGTPHGAELPSGSNSAFKELLSGVVGVDGSVSVTSIPGPEANN